MLDAITGKHHCNVSLSVDDHLKEFFIFDVSYTNVQTKSNGIIFVADMLHNIKICAEESLSSDTVGIDPKIQNEVRKKIKDRQELANVWVEFVGDDNPVTVYTVCPKDQQQLVMQKLTEVISDATKSSNSHKEMVMSDFMWQMVMKRFEYLKEIGLKFPSTEIIQDKNKNAFLLKGHQDEVKAAAGHLEELLKMAHKEVDEEVFSPGYQFEIFTSEMCDCIDKSLQKLPVIWIPNHLTKEIHLFSRDPELLKGMDKSIKGCMKEKLYPVLKKISILPSEKICLLEELRKKHKGRIVISRLESPPGVLVTTAGDIFGGVDAEVQKILSSKRGIMHPKTFVSEIPGGRDGEQNCKSDFGATNSDVENKNLPSEIF
ncbi:hypothetical protein ACJMK2_006877 [Sinanodonta woodiana]|uniref:Uncharacterized protein n=1 Tax=Sinanodonta woodiana TaxID=1069815 RepID=A0ABD3VW63_SINWO